MGLARIASELEPYRRLMEPPAPEDYDEGFGTKILLGALFVAFVMLPGAAYLGLVTGVGLGSAPQWVTVILFVEVARRSFVTLKRQEVYLLVFLASALLGTNPYSGYIWNAYLRTSQVTEGLGVAKEIPTWVVPPADSPALIYRTFLHPDWIVPILVSLALLFFTRASAFTFGYLLFRLTSDYERLPFPLAAVSAQGATVLAEISRKEESWRWRYFSIGAMIGLAFGFFYAGIPTITGALMSRPLELIPIPFIDLTLNTESILPATPVVLGTSADSFLVGFVVPFWSAVGGFVAMILSYIINPILYRRGFLVNWRPGLDARQTEMLNVYDFWLSARIGLSLGVAIIGIASLIQTVLRARQETAARRGPQPGEIERIPLTKSLPHRGDLPTGLIFVVYLLSTAALVLICFILLNRLPVLHRLIFPMFFAFVFTPVVSYISAKMQGLTGIWVGIPFIFEGFAILYSKLTGYRGLDIWFAPLPIHEWGGVAQHFRVVELTGTKFTGVLKTEILIVVVGLLSNLLVWQYLWRLAPIPSFVYPFAQKMWPMYAFTQALLWTTTMGGRRQIEALKPPIIAWSCFLTLAAYLIYSPTNLPMLFFYGMVTGLSGMPVGNLLTFAGALVSRYYFEKLYEETTWRRYATVMLAGFSCGMGLVGMFCAAIAMVSKAVSQLPY
ncbi:MAG: OPT/YSL family transporter [Armatimonadetes bacterium]|nr:OPT/YSL family transporter [Armatimonadota bacterium]MDW8121498.1 hypothetical protein [Armatimonadota bacterium]